MKEFDFDIRLEKYKIGDYVFNNDFSYDEVMTMGCPKYESQAELINILNAHMEEGSKLTGDIKFRKITFISRTLIKGFLEDMEKL